MKLLLTSFLLLGIVSFASAREEQKQEGNCSGQLVDGKTISFTYFSDYDGCQENILGAIKFSRQSGLGNHKGKRTFANDKDIYSFKAYRLSFDDSTGNDSGELDYKDSQGLNQTITVQCVVRDYEYQDCE